MGISGFGPNALVRRGPDIAEYIRDLIISRQLKAGDRVRAEQVAAALDVSATPVREALRSLQAQGFLTSVHNRGFVVTRLSADDIHDVYISIGLLVGELAARAAKTADEKDLAPIREIQRRLRALQKSPNQAGVTELATDFYKQLHILGRSPKIVSTVLMLDMYTTRELRASIPGWLEDAIQFQDLLLAAIEAHQPEVARAAVRGYMDEVAKVYSQRLETESESAPPTLHPADVQDSIQNA